MFIIKITISNVKNVIIIIIIIIIIIKTWRLLSVFWSSLTRETE